jgi:hypothetical protein
VKTERKRSDSWHRLDSGIFVPVGSVLQYTQFTRTSLPDLKADAIRIEELYNRHKVRLSRQSGLGKLIATVKASSDRWILNEESPNGMPDHFQSLHFGRVAEGLLTLGNVENPSEYLRRMLDGSLDFFERRKSVAKNTLWELSLFARLRARHQDVWLKDPPDICVQIGKTRVGIACKKVYSVKNLSKLLSEAVSQVGDESAFGVAALNIDEFIPGQHLLKKPTSSDAFETLRTIKDKFIAEQQGLFSRYLVPGRIIAVLVDITVLADIPGNNPRFNNAFLSAIWSLTNPPAHLEGVAGRLYEAMTGRIE